MQYTYILCVAVGACLSRPVVWSAAASADLGDQLFKLLPDDGGQGDHFGASVAISGATAIVGAQLQLNNNNCYCGAAYLFDTTTGQQLFELQPNDGAAGDFFGISVAISGATAVVGAYEDDDNGNSSGSVYLFDTTGRQIAKLLADDAEVDDRFGIAVAISGATAIVGARWDDDNGNASGSAYLFDTTTGLQIAKLLPNDSAVGDEFGFSVAISGATASVGAYLNDDNGSNSGSAYLFDAGAPGKCPWDLDDNEVVGVSDLLSLLASWGPCKGCPADFDGNGAVGVSDLLVLLANWGPCP